MDEETGWLIEIATPEGARWYTINSNFTNDSFEALRFARKIDAESGIVMLGLQGMKRFCY